MCCRLRLLKSVVCFNRVHAAAHVLAVGAQPADRYVCQPPHSPPLHLPLTAGKPPQELRLSAALRQPSPSLTQLDFELLTDHRMLRVVKSMIQARSSS